MEALHNPTRRVISLLDYISKAGKATLQECSRTLAIPIGTLFPIMKTLVSLHYINFDESSKQYTIGIGIFLAGSSFVSQSSSYSSIKAVLNQITEACNENVHFATLEGGDVLYLAKTDTNQAVRTYSYVGARIPAYGTALGKVMLANLSLEELKSLYPHGLKKLTKNTITSIDDLYESLKEVKKTGFSFEKGESNESVCCIAKALYENGVPRAAISVAVPIFRFTNDLKTLIIEELKNGAVQLEKIIPFLSF
jgi:DNA-binding IclR family transcriptional regulator